MFTMMYTLLSLTHASEDTQSILLVNPLLPSLSLFGDGIVSLTELEDFMKFRVWDANLRGYQIYTDRWGLMAQLDYTQSNLITKSTHIGCKLGPRLSLQNSGFEGWSLSTYGIIGVTSLSASRYPLAKWAVYGVGTELGRSFVWEHFVLDLGFGLYTTKNGLYSSSAAAFQDSHPPPGLSTIPSIHTGIGYAF